MSTWQHVLVAEVGPITRMTLNRPDRRNALSLDLMRELQRALEQAAGRVVVIAGAGPAFSAGHDLTELTACEGDEAAELFATCSTLMMTVQSIPQPVIAQVHGVATAAGCQLVASCDLAVATTDARFATPGVRIGLFCSTPMVPLTRSIGPKRAMQMLLTGDLIDARHRDRLGADQRCCRTRRARRGGHRARHPHRRGQPDGAGARQAHVLRADRAPPG